MIIIIVCHSQFDVKQIPSIVLKQVLKRHPMSIDNVRRYFSNPRSFSPRHLELDQSDSQRFVSSIGTSGSLSPLKHSPLHSTPYEDGTVTKDFIRFDQSRSLITRSAPLPSFIKHSTGREPLCFSSPCDADFKRES